MVNLLADLRGYFERREKGEYRTGDRVRVVEGKRDGAVGTITRECKPKGGRYDWIVLLDYDPVIVPDAMMVVEFFGEDELERVRWWKFWRSKRARGGE